MTSISELKLNVADNITVSDPIIDNNNIDDNDSDENETDDEVIDEAYIEDIILEHEYDDTYADNINEIAEPTVTIDAVDEVDEWGF